jgi:cell division septal protein FtsQ
MAILKARQPDTTRAQSLRQKRSEQGSQRTARKTPTVASRAAVPASRVVSRSSATGAQRRPAATQPRRKVYYSVGKNGVETRLPALPIIHFNWRWVSAALALTLLVLVLVLTNLPGFQVSVVEASGLQRLKTEDLTPVILANSSSVFTLDTNILRDKIAVAFPELSSVEVKVQLPNLVTVNAVERQPVIAWKTTDQVYWIDLEGAVFAPRGELDNLLVIKSEVLPPLTREVAPTQSVIDYAMQVLNTQTDPLTPEEAVNYIDPQVFNAAITLSALMPTGAKLVYDPVAGMGWRDPNGWRVYFGNDLSNIQSKQMEYQTIIENLQKMGINPLMVSVEYLDAPYFRTE